MLQRLRHRAQGQEGFTLIELLVVILIIGILAAVAIPTFLNQTGKANDATVKSDIRTAQTAEETWYTDHQAFTGTTADLQTIEPTLATPIKAVKDGGEALVAEVPAKGYYPTSAALTGADNFDITATSKSGVLYALVRAADGTVTRTCEVPKGTNPGGCQLASGKDPSAATVDGNW